MRFFVIIPLFLAVLAQIVNATGVPVVLNVKAGTRVEMQFKAVPKQFFRYVQRNGQSQEQVFRVCNGKNKATCGYWEIKKTKKKVTGSMPNYNVKKNMLIYPKVKATDAGVHSTTADTEMFYVFVS